MNLIVDTSVWSLVLRRQKVNDADPGVIAFRKSVEQGDRIFLLGNILQELLDGVKNQRHFENLLEILKPFPLATLTRETYIEASKLRNHCRQKGVQASSIDFLIAATSLEHAYPLLTTDKDFIHIAKHCPLVLV